MTETDTDTETKITNKYWLVWVDEMNTNASCVELVYCATEEEAIELGSKVHNMEKELLDTCEKIPHIRKLKSKPHQTVTNDFWIVYVPDIELWEADLIYCDTKENAIKSSMYMHSLTN